MALARVVTFEGVSASRIAELEREVREKDPPEGLNPTEMTMLHDPDSGRAVVMFLFDNEEDYRRGDEILGSMPASDTPGQRASVEKYQVALRMTQ